MYFNVIYNTRYKRKQQKVYIYLWSISFGIAHHYILVRSATHRTRKHELVMSAAHPRPPFHNLFPWHKLWIPNIQKLKRELKSDYFTKYFLIQLFCLSVNHTNLISIYYVASLLDIYLGERSLIILWSSSYPNNYFNEGIIMLFQSSITTNIDDKTYKELLLSFQGF